MFISPVSQQGIGVITKIDCGTSSPQLAGSVNISPFTNLNSFKCVNNGITTFTGNTLCPKLTTLSLGQNNLTSFPSFTNMPLLQELRLDNNDFTGSIPSLNSLTSLVTVRFNQNTGITGNIPSLSLLTNLQSFYCIGCNMTGVIPPLVANTVLKDFRCDSQIAAPKLNGSIPSLTTNTQLQFFYGYNNQFSGNIPDLSNNTTLFEFRVHNNQLTGWTGGTVSNTTGLFEAQDNLLTQAAVDAILAAFVAANKTTGTRTLNLGGTGNASPTGGQFNANKVILEGRGWTVTVN
jgi:hypothetical protein